MTSYILSTISYLLRPRIEFWKINTARRDVGPYRSVGS
jgi:hypothetical protein